VREVDDQKTQNGEDDLNEALRAAVIATLEKIDGAFGRQAKVVARLRDR